MSPVSLVSIDARDRTPIYAQLDRALRAAIATGRLQPGDQLPTVRQLAVDLQVNANTVARVYAELERSGILPPREHDRRLRAFVTRVQADAHSAGFDLDDVIAALGESHR